METETLNSAQYEAVTSTEGYIRVIAGAGSGKTRALTYRFAYLVNELGIRPGHILCVTFTNKAAALMRKRIHELTGDNDTGYICTFHSFCAAVLLKDGYALGLPKSFLVLDNADIDDMLAIIYEERGLTLKDMTYADARDMFEMRKGQRERSYYGKLLYLSLEDLRMLYDEAQKLEDILFYGYLYQERKCCGLDYNDLMIMTMALFTRHDDIRTAWEKQLEYIMIDEFQDIDPLQYELMAMLCGYHKNLFIVGDPDQTIYTWRGARTGYTEEFKKSFPQVKTVMMMENYRSCPSIINVANSLISHNNSRVKKDLIPTRSDSRPVRYHHAADAHEEGAFIAGEIAGLVEEGYAYGDIAVLYRAHYISRAIEDELLKKKIPYTLYSGTPFFSRAEIKDALSYLRMIVMKDDLSFRRIANVPKRNLGKRRMAYLEDYAAEHDGSLYEALIENVDNELFAGTGARKLIGLIEDLRRSYHDRPVSEVLGEVLDKSGYEKMLKTSGDQTRLNNLAELKQSVFEYETTAGEENDILSYLRHVAVFTSLDGVDLRRDCVKLMTVHAAKGLEFNCVFMASLCENIFPSRKAVSQPAMEEERRLAFVGMTRAKDVLILSDHEGKGYNGAVLYPSRFILNIDPACLSFDAKLSEELVQDAHRFIAHNEECLLPSFADLPFKPGDRINHAVFGDGVLLAFNEREGTLEIQFDKMHTPRQLTVRALNKLRKI